MQPISADRWARCSRVGSSLAVYPSVSGTGKAKVDPHRPSGTNALACLTAYVLLSVACVNHYAVHPRTVPPAVRTWSEDRESGPLRIHLEWAAPALSGSLPTVLVHPEAGSDARDMRGVIWDLAAHGYLAVSADYRRLIDGRYRRTLFPWREPADETRVLDLVRGNSTVNADRIGVIGFSQGAVFSLVMAAQDPRIRAVVAYYPVTDFEHWLNDPSRDFIHRIVFWFIRRHFRKESGSRSDEEFAAMLELASPLRQARSITAPVLLIHGVKDTTAPVDESRNLARALTEMNRSVALIEVRGAGHLFNFYDRYAADARLAWQAVLDCFARCLSGSAGE